ncbi:hypothetical protein [Lagierella sp.]|uniref:hypothetical protein n=1 Tax=Lagierella sp. TaxID=2849657 RepID=UPI00262DA456|nr:hypothetical protein [Lagierella sp.]
MSNKKITFLGVIAGATIAGRILMAPFPNIQPVTTILIFATIYIGFVEALILNFLVIFISNLYLGFGPWTIYQILSFATIILIAFLLKVFKEFRQSHLLQSIFSIVSGFIYGFIISLFTAASFSKADNFFIYYLNGLYFDLLHGLGNGVLYFLLVPPLKKGLDRYFS